MFSSIFKLRVVAVTLVWTEPLRRLIYAPMSPEPAELHHSLQCVWDPEPINLSAAFLPTLPPLGVPVCVVACQKKLIQ